MPEIHYLGATQNQTHLPGVLYITTPVNNLTAGELDLLLAKQRIEIEKQNSATLAGVFNFQQDNYTQALGVIQKCIANINNPDVICGIGENIEAIGKKKGGKTAAGKLLQKAGKGIKQGIKAITKVAAAPAKLILEVYLPKASPAFLYLFVPEKDCPDVMKAKRKKAVKFKNAIVNGMGMQEKHFMAIVRNNLTKLLKQSPESFIAAKLRNRQSGISGIGKDGKQRSSKKQLRSKNGGKLPKLVKQQNKIVKVKATAAVVKHSLAPALAHRTTPDTSHVILNPVAPKPTTPTFSNSLLQDALQALMFILGKLKGQNTGAINTKDFADIEKDAANAFEYKDMEENYDNLNDAEKENVKDTATDLLVKNAPENEVVTILRTRNPKLTPQQVDEVAYEVKEGAEALDVEEGYELGTKIKKSVVDTTEGDLNKFEKTGGGTGTGACSC